MEMNKEKIVKIFLILIVTIGVAVTLIRGYFFLSPSPDKIYSKSLSSVVELRAYSENMGESHGSAIFVDEKGTLVTNAHVVTNIKGDEYKSFDTYEIRFATEEEYHFVELIAYDTDIDLAILRLKDESCIYEPIKMKEEISLYSGENVYAIGNSMDYGVSISEGIVGIPLLEIEYQGKVRQVIQCDITITEGNSGGALLNEKGELVGITTFRMKDDDGEIVYGLSYSIPFNEVEKYLNSNGINVMY